LLILENIMTTPTINTRKDYFGKWVATSNIALAGDRQLKISTSKDQRGNLTTYASVAIVRNEAGARIETFEVYGDYMKSIRKSQPKMVNEKRAREQQELVLEEDLQLVLCDVKNFYAEKGIEV
jgi:hypothetical protein